jgi:hypothetical protein
MAQAPYNDELDYAPRSPNLNPQYDSYEPEPLHPQHQSYRGSISQASPFSPTGNADYFGRASFSAFPPPNMPVPKMEPDDEEYGTPRRGRGRGKKIKHEDEMDTGGNGDENGAIEVKTKFPVARIKRIMQADEDVGKVAQVTPVAVGKSTLRVHLRYRIMLTVCSQSFGAFHGFSDNPLGW